MAEQRAVWVLHLDVDAFFAALEQRDDPLLRGKPVAVGTGVVASCSYEAKRRGVGTGMRLADARRACPGLVVVPGDYRKYEIAGRQILGICQERAPRVEVAALDDLYLQLHAERSCAERLAQQLAEQVRREVGLRVSLGLAANRLAATVATLRVKRRKARGLSGGDLEVVEPGTEREYLAPWPVEVLPGVGPKVSERLGQLNVRQVAELAEVPEAVLCGLFGARGRVLRHLARGVDHRGVQPARAPRSLSRRTSFDPPACEPAFLTAMLDHLLDRAASALRARNLSARGLTVVCRYGDYRFADSRVSFGGPVQDEEELRLSARERFGRVYTRRLPLRLLGVELSPVVAADGQQGLFPDPERERRQRLRACQDEIRARFGFLAVMRGTALQLHEALPHDRDNYHLRTPCLTR